MTTDFYKSKYNQAIGAKNTLEANKRQYTDKIATNLARMESIEKAQALIQKVAQETQELLTFQINDVVNTALSTCFPDEYVFKIEFEIKREKTEAKLIFIKNGFEINPMSASGGGVVDVASFALRIAAWSLSNYNNTLIIDEGFRFLSRDLQPRAAEILEEISKKLNLQIVQVSHSPDIIEKSDKVFSVALVKGVSKVNVEE